MITRILHTRFWEDEYIASLEKEGKLLFCYLLLNEKNNKIGCYEVSDNRIMADTAIELEVIHRLMHKFTIDKKITRYKNWVRIINHDKYNSFTGAKNDKGKENELKLVPEELFEDVRDTSIDTSIDTTHNHNHNHNNINKGKNDTSIDTSIEKPAKRFIKPSLEDIKAYCSERENFVDAQRFLDYYESNGWKVGKNAMKDWKAAVRTWENNGYSTGSGSVKSNGAVKAEKNKYQGR